MPEVLVLSFSRVRGFTDGVLRVCFSNLSAGLCDAASQPLGWLGILSQRGLGVTASGFGWSLWDGASSIQREAFCDCPDQQLGDMGVLCAREVNRHESRLLSRRLSLTVAQRNATVMRLRFVELRFSYLFSISDK